MYFNVNEGYYGECEPPVGYIKIGCKLNPERIGMMDCKCCGGKMVKAKYLHFEELEGYLEEEYTFRHIEDYGEWLKSLNENDLVLTLFKRQEYRVE